MPWNEVMDKWKSGALKSGGSGKQVTSQKQAVAIMLSEKRAAQGGKKEYQPVKKQSGGTFRRSVMGRQVIHHSPDKHPEQMDPAAWDQQIEEAAKGSTGTYSNMRQQMKPFQAPEPRDTGSGASGAMDYIKKQVKGYLGR
jgi:hypothetical protein